MSAYVTACWSSGFQHSGGGFCKPVLRYKRKLKEKDSEMTKLRKECDELRAAEIRALKAGDTFSSNKLTSLLGGLSDVFGLLWNLCIMCRYVD